MCSLTTKQAQSRAGLTAVGFCLLMGWSCISPGHIAGSKGEASENEWVSLFDGSSLEGWEVTNFGGEGRVYVGDGAITLEMGETLTGITYSGEFPKTNFEIKLQGRRLKGNDFFCGLTFPIGDEFCTLILGGWGGTVVGISNIDGMDASENSTTDYFNFERGRWYDVGVRVTDQLVSASIDGTEILQVERDGTSFDVRPEVRLSRPLGIATWVTTGSIRGIRYRRLESGTRDQVARPATTGPGS